MEITHRSVSYCYDVCSYPPQNKEYGLNTCVAVQWLLTDKLYLIFSKALYVLNSSLLSSISLVTVSIPSVKVREGIKQSHRVNVPLCQFLIFQIFHIWQDVIFESTHLYYKHPYYSADQVEKCRLDRDARLCRSSISRERLSTWLYEWGRYSRCEKRTSLILKKHIGARRAAGADPYYVGP